MFSVISNPKLANTCICLRRGRGTPFQQRGTERRKPQENVASSIMSKSQKRYKITSFLESITELSARHPSKLNSK